MSRKLKRLAILFAIFLISFRVEARGEDHLDETTTSKKLVAGLFAPSTARKFKLLTKSGFVVDFSNKELFPKGNVVSAAELRDVLLTSEIPSSGGIDIRGAHIQGALNLSSIKISTLLRFTSCEFDQTLHLNNTIASNGLFFDSCKGLSISAFGAKVDGLFVASKCQLRELDLSFLESKGLVLQNCTVAPSSEVFVDLNNIRINGYLQISDCKFSQSFTMEEAAIEGTASLTNNRFYNHFSSSKSSIGSSLSIEKSQFSKHAYFRNTKILNNFLGSQSHFADKSGIADFSGMNVGGIVDLHGCKFDAHFSINTTRIAGDLILATSQFNSDAALMSLSVMGSINSGSATYRGIVSYALTSCGLNASFRGCTFGPSDVPFNGAQMSVGGALDFGECKFRRGADFTNTKIKGPLGFEQIWASTESGVFDFTSSIVEGDFLAGFSRFNCPITLVNAKIGGSLLALKSHLEVRSPNRRSQKNHHSESYQHCLSCINTYIGGKVLLNESLVTGNVHFLLTSIGSDVSLKSSTFCGADCSVSFRQSTIGGEFDLENSHFFGRFDASHLEVRSIVKADSIASTNRDYFVSFDNSSIGGFRASSPSFMPPVLFAGGLSMNQVTLNGDFELANAKCNNTTKTTGLSFNDAAIRNGKFSISNCDIFGSINLSRLKVDGRLVITDCSLEGLDWTLHRATVGDNLAIIDSTIVLETADFRQMVLGGALLLRNSKFMVADGNFDCSGMEIKSNVELVGSDFECQLNLSSIQANELTAHVNALSDNGRPFNRTIFRQGLYLHDAKITRDLILFGARFMSSDSAAGVSNMVNLERISIGGTLNASECSFEIPVNIVNGNVSKIDLNKSNLKARGHVKQALNAEGLISREGIDASQTKWLGDISLVSLTSSGDVIFDSAMLEDSRLSLFRAKVDGTLTFRRASANRATLTMDGVQVDELHIPKISTWGLRALSLRGFNCERLVAEQVESSQLSKGGEVDLEFLQNAAYDSTAYENAARRLSEMGRSDAATRVHLESKRRERASYGFWRRSLDAALDLSSGYMTSPQRLLFISVGLVVFGYFVFGGKPFNLAMSRVHSSSGSYSAFWYSVYLFLPFDNIPMVDEWMPSANRKIALQYRYLHQLLGWVLLTVSVGGVISKFAN
ncbi:hypothetical protein [Verrucomicrobium spinosum]|uniref:hypothetical protein n=1 Tax=Verrucomicrobium spinosum TaxID=2736 RepID=UPI0012F6B126|nr:hypothetical protein [Verrucomicrobium spinosum]